MIEIIKENPSKEKIIFHKNLFLDAYMSSSIFGFEKSNSLSIYLAIKKDLSNEYKSLLNIEWSEGTKVFTKRLFYKILKSNKFRNIVNIILSENNVDLNLKNLLNLLYVDKNLFAKKCLPNHKFYFYEDYFDVENCRGIPIFRFFFYPNSYYVYKERPSFIFNTDSWYDKKRNKKAFNPYLSMYIDPNSWCKKGLMKEIFKLYYFIRSEIRKEGG